MLLLQTLFILTVATWSVTNAHSYTPNSRAERFLTLFSVVNFKNSECTSGSDTGICYLARTCRNNGGTTSGSCADGFGQCCVTKLGCGGRSSNNCTYIQSPGYPSTFNSAMTCVQTITLRSDVCQVRMDVTEVTLAAPDNTGACNTDYLTFSQDNKWNRVCGVTTNTHFYLEVDPSTSSSLDFTFTTTDTSTDRRWRIKVTQICCDQLSMAPMGCGQYYTSTTGTIKGWNSDATNNAFYLSGQNYAICMRKEINRCSTTYTESAAQRFIPVCGDTLEWPFPFVGGTPAASPSCNNPGVNVNAAPSTGPLQGPQYLYLVTTTDEANDHSLLGNPNLNIAFTQNAC